MYRRRRRVLVAWIVLLVGAFAVGNAVGGVFRTEFKLPGSESQAAVDLLKRSGFNTRSGDQAQVVFQARQGVDDPAVRDAMEKLFAQITRQVSRTSVVSPYSQEGEHQIAQGGHIAYAQVNLADRDSNALSDAGDTIQSLADQVHVDGLHVALGGDMFQTSVTNGTSEGVGLLAAMVILLIAFGSVLAMGLPIGTALFGVGTGIALVLIVRTAIDMPSFTTAAVAMVGIGVGIDYALFLVTRYRESLHAGLEPEAAVVRAVDTSGRAVLFAGTTVLISILGLLFIGQSVIRGVAIAIAIGVAMTMVASVTLLPALLGFVGHNIDRLGLPHRRRAEATGHESVWYRWSRVLQRRPWPPLIIGFLFLLTLAVPTVAMRLGFSDAGNRPTSDTTRQAYDLLSEGFGPGFNGPLLLATETPGGASDVTVLQRLSRELNQTSGIAFATPPQPNPDGTAAIMQVFPKTAPQDEATASLVSRLRDDILPRATAGTGVHVLVGGVTAAADDYASYTESRLPIFIGAVLILSFLLLMTVFRSLLVPLKAVVMNLLSIGAAYGVVVAVFQWGWGASLFGVGRAGPIEAWAPIMMFAIVFGLSMDYEVFLLSRIKEEYDHTHDNATAVADGLAVTARVITAAAAIMVCVFGSFVFGDERALQVFGLGLAVAVLADATVVRLILVPATMELLGDKNWWIPRWLDRSLPHINVEPVDQLDAELAALEAQSRSRV
jgi:putative drug exporter of the RND superfamily